MVTNLRDAPGDAGVVLPHVMTDAQLRTRRLRNIVIGLLVGGLCVLFYVMTIAKLGAGFLSRPI